MFATIQRAFRKLHAGTPIFLCVVCSLSLAGCYTTPVRHLDDISTLKKGYSTDKDVLDFLGNPDHLKQEENGTAKWIYQNRRKSFAQKIPFFGGNFGEEGLTTVVISLHNHIVSDIEYYTTAPNESGWQRRSR